MENSPSVGPLFPQVRHRYLDAAAADFEGEYVRQVLLGSNNNLNLVGLNSLVLHLSHYVIDKNCQNEKYGPLVFY